MSDENWADLDAAYNAGLADGAKAQRNMDTTTLFRNGEMRAADILDACPLAHTHDGGTQ